MQRNHTIDIARFTAAFGVIMIHLAPSTPTAENITQYFSATAVPFFFISSLFFFQQKGTSWKKDYMLRLTIPYLTWSVLYVAMRAVKYYIQGQPIHFQWHEILLFGTGAVHLYFIPALLFMQTLAYYFYHLFTPNHSWKKRALSLTLLCSLYALSHYLKSFEYQAFSQNIFETSLIYILFNSLLIRTTQTPNTMARATLMKIALVLSITLFYLSQKFPLTLPLLQNGSIACAILSLCLLLPLRNINPSVATLLSMSYGIYLAHFAILEVAETTLHKINFNLPPYSLTTKLIFSTLILLTSILCIRLLRKNKHLSYLFLGEIPQKT